jgi:hypothetical protein
VSIDLSLNLSVENKGVRQYTNINIFVIIEISNALINFRVASAAVFGGPSKSGRLMVSHW